MIAKNLLNNTQEEEDRIIDEIKELELFKIFFP